jgi:hypothetical protein
MPNVDASEFTRLKRFKGLRNDVDPNAVDQIKFRGPASVSQPRVPYPLNFLNEFIPTSATEHSTFPARQFSYVKRGR